MYFYLRNVVGNSELIDTCWDVNEVTILFLVTLTLELIDTCWDVNERNPASNIR